MTPGGTIDAELPECATPKGPPILRDGEAGKPASIRFGRPTRC